jgi:hypothetical protein
MWLSMQKYIFGCHYDKNIGQWLQDSKVNQDLDHFCHDIQVYDYIQCGHGNVAWLLSWYLPKWIRKKKSYIYHGQSDKYDFIVIM